MEQLDFIIKPIQGLLLFVGGAMLKGLYHKIMFSKKANYFLRVQKKTSGVRVHYVAHMYCLLANANYSGKKLVFEERLAGIDKELVEELQTHLNKSIGSYGDVKYLALKLDKVIKKYIESYTLLEECLSEREGDSWRLSKNLLDCYLVMCRLLSVLTEGTVLEEGPIEILYAKHELDMHMKSVISKVRGGKIYYKGDYF